MRQARPTSSEIASGIATAERAVTAAAEVRKRYFRRQTPQRQPALAHARDKCADATWQLRSWIGMCAWGGISNDDEIAMKKVMEALRYERRQIDKMLS